MLNPIALDFKKFVLKAMTNYAKKFSTKQDVVKDESIQIAFKLNEKGENVYTILKDYNSQCNVTIKELLNVKVDFLGYTSIVPPVIKETLQIFGSQKSMEPNAAVIMMIKRDEAQSKRIAEKEKDLKEDDKSGIDKNIKIALYNKSVFIEELFFDDIVSQIQI